MYKLLIKNIWKKIAKYNISISYLFIIYFFIKPFPFFYIKNDLYLINAIKQFFNATNKVRNPYKNFYSLEIYKKEILNKIINHCKDYPLLGEKTISLNKFIEIFQK